MHKAKPRKQSLLLAGVIAFVVLLLILRLFVFVYGHGRHRYQGAGNGMRVSMASLCLSQYANCGKLRLAALRTGRRHCSGRTIPATLEVQL
jgi:hypothetical protein